MILESLKKILTKNNNTGNKYNFSRNSQVRGVYWCLSLSGEDIPLLL